MADESNVLPTSRVARWIAIAGLIAFAVALYFRDGRQLPPVTASSAAPTAPAAPQPTR